MIVTARHIRAGMTVVAPDGRTATATTDADLRSDGTARWRQTGGITVALQSEEYRLLRYADGRRPSHHRICVGGNGGRSLLVTADGE